MAKFSKSTSNEKQRRDAVKTPKTRRRCLGDKSLARDSKLSEDKLRGNEPDTDVSDCVGDC